MSGEVYEELTGEPMLDYDGPPHVLKREDWKWNEETLFPKCAKRAGLYVVATSEANC